MSILQKIEPDADDLRQLFPEISPETYALRGRLRSARNVAQFALLQSQPGGTVDQLLAVLERHAGVWVYAPATIDMLADAVETAQAIYRAVQAAEKLEAFGQPG
jgi:hypothetical protein